MIGNRPGSALIARPAAIVVDELTTRRNWLLTIARPCFPASLLAGKFAGNFARIGARYPSKMTI